MFRSICWYRDIQIQTLELIVSIRLFGLDDIHALDVNAIGYILVCDWGGVLWV